MRTRRSVVKSPSRGRELAEAERVIVIFRRELRGWGGPFSPSDIDGQIELYRETI
jgi:hypothetical protein